MRRSSRRRVIPRAVQLGQQGHGVLAGDPRGLAELADGEPRGPAGEQGGGKGGGGADGVGVPPQAVPLDQDAAADQLAQLGPLDPDRRPRAPARRRPARRRRGDRRAGRARRAAGPSTPSPRRRRARRAGRGRARRASPRPARRRGGRRARGSRRGEDLAGRRPIARRRPAAARPSAAPARRRRSSPARRRRARRSGRDGPSTPGAPGRRRGSRRRRPSRRDPTPAARSGRRAAAAGRWRGAAAPRPWPPGAIVSGPSTRSAHRVLAGAEVGEVGAAARHHVVEAVEDVQRGVDHRRGVPAVGHDDGVAPPQLRVIDAAEVEGDAVAGPDRVDRPTRASGSPGPATSMPCGSTRSAVARSRSPRRSASR